MNTNEHINPNDIQTTKIGRGFWVFDIQNLSLQLRSGQALSEVEWIGHSLFIIQYLDLTPWSSNGLISYFLFYIWSEVLSPSSNFWLLASGFCILTSVFY